MTSQYSCKYKATNMAAMADVCEYKIVLLGDPGVGKTTWFLRIKQGEFVDTENHQTVSMGVEHLEHKITVQGKDGPKEVKGYLHDTGGGERFRTLTANFYRNADAAILMYSVEDKYTFENLQEWVDNASDVVEMDNFVFALVGNKCDLPLEVEHESIKARCESLHTQLSFFTSAKTGDNVLEAFEKILEHVHKVKGGKSSCKPPHQNIVGPKVSRPSKGSCCKTQ